MSKLGTWGDLMKRRKTIRLVSYALAALLVLGGFLLRSEGEKRLLSRQVEHGYARAFTALSSDLTQLQTALTKCACSASPALTGEACGEIWARSQSAQANLGALPLSDRLLENTAGFLGKLGDYALAMTRRCAAGGLSGQERKTLAALGETARSLNETVLELSARLEDGSMSLTAAETTMDRPGDGVGAALTDWEDSFPELPTLIYDGPYSESAAIGPARMLEGLEPVTEAEARAAASAFTGLPAEEFELLGRGSGQPETYLLGTARGDVTLRVTRQGGLVLDMVSDRLGGEAALSPEEGVERAKTFLSDKGYPDMRESYWTREGDTVLVNFAWSQNGVVCYPDLIKVRVELSGGRILGFDAHGYLQNHRVRSLPKPLGREAARQAVWEELTVLSEGLALIPTGDRQERCCWEFKCEMADGSHCIVYADAATGEEVRVLLLLESENGTLTL